VSNGEDLVRSDNYGASGCAPLDDGGIAAMERIWDKLRAAQAEELTVSRR
jgi:hypothetical protein